MDNAILKPTRQSNFELLRIISMIMIVCHHFAIYSGFDLNKISVTNQIVINILFYGGHFAVNIFVMISGYFLVKSKFNILKVIKLWIDITFFSLIIYIIFAIINKSLTLPDLITNSLPIIYNKWWFATSYSIIFFYQALLILL